MVVFEINDGELMAGIEARARAAGITAGAIVSLIGAADRFTVSTMAAADATNNVVTEHTLPAEITGTGEIVDGKPHIHVVMAVAGDRAISGHLHRATIGTWFVRAYVLPASTGP